jgi:hypothetical protein
MNKSRSGDLRKVVIEKRKEEKRKKKANNTNDNININNNNNNNRNEKRMNTLSVRINVHGFLVKLALLLIQKSLSFSIWIRSVISTGTIASATATTTASVITAMASTYQSDKLD